MSLQSLYNLLLPTERPDKVLRLADKYIQHKAEMGNSFILPDEHAYLAPVVKQFDNDLAGWMLFVKSLRDSVEPRSHAYIGLQQLHRILLIRHMQQTRRERISAAVDKAVELGRVECTPDAKHRYARQCVQQWKLMREAVLDAARRQSKTGRVSIAEREDILAEFWAEIDAGIKQGELP